MELSWQQFRNQNHIRILTENEQVRQYYFYLDTLPNQNSKQNKGAKQSRLVSIGFLLQENLDVILQENNESGIYITEYA